MFSGNLIDLIVALEWRGTWTEPLETLAASSPARTPSSLTPSGSRTRSAPATALEVEMQSDPGVPARFIWHLSRAADQPPDRFPRAQRAGRQGRSGCALGQGADGAPEQLQNAASHPGGTSPTSTARTRDTPEAKNTKDAGYCADANILTLASRALNDLCHTFG